MTLTDGRRKQAKGPGFDVPGRSFILSRFVWLLEFTKRPAKRYSFLGSGKKKHLIMHIALSVFHVIPFSRDFSLARAYL
jgi:hypothetical protein